MLLCRIFKYQAVNGNGGAVGRESGGGAISSRNPCVESGNQSPYANNMVSQVTSRTATARVSAALYRPVIIWDVETTGLSARN